MNHSLPKPPTPSLILLEHRKRSPAHLQQFVRMFHLLDARDRTELLLYELQALSQRLAMLATALDKDLGPVPARLEAIEKLLARDPHGPERGDQHEEEAL